jgi:hypothetical protein
MRSFDIDLVGFLTAAILWAAISWWTLRTPPLPPIDRDGRS